MTVVQALLRLKGGGCWSIFDLVYNCGAQVQTANVARKWRISHFHCLPPQTTVLSRGLQPPAHTGYTHGAGERPPPSQLHHSTASPGQGEHCHAPSMGWMPNHDSPWGECPTTTLRASAPRSPTGNRRWNGVSLPAEELVGTLGKGWQQLLRTRGQMRSGTPEVGCEGQDHQWAELYCPIRLQLHDKFKDKSRNARE